MKKRFLAIVFVLIFTASILFAGCFESVVPAAWVHLKVDDGYVYYSTDMYASNRSHIYYFENQEAAENLNNYMIEIIFYPRILGPEEVEVDGEKIKTTIVDISNYADISIYIRKASPIYSANKDIYINGEKINPTSINDYNTLVSILIQDAPLVRGNPNGRINGKINYIEYK